MSTNAKEGGTNLRNVRIEGSCCWYRACWLPFIRTNIPSYCFAIATKPEEAQALRNSAPSHRVAGADDDEDREGLDSHRQPLQLLVEQQQRQMAMNTEREPDSHVLLVREATAHYRLNPKVRLRQNHRLLPSYWPVWILLSPLFSVLKS
jgi:hypothetical protein